MTTSRARGRGRDLQQIAAAGAGTAAASQVVVRVSADLAEEIERGFWRIATDGGVTIADVQDSTCDISGRTPEFAQVQHVLRDMAAAGRARSGLYLDLFFPLWPDDAADEPDPASVVHYVVRGSGVTSCCGRPPLELPIFDRMTDGTERVPDEVDCPGLHSYAAPYDKPGVKQGPAEISVVGANGRRLLARWSPEGVWVGGCLIADPAHAGRLAAFITREADE